MTDNFKQELLAILKELIENPQDAPNPFVVKWRYEEYPDWTVAVGFKQDAKQLELELT